jgi:hypothetical protein
MAGYGDLDTASRMERAGYGEPGGAIDGDSTAIQERFNGDSAARRARGGWWLGKSGARRHLGARRLAPHPRFTGPALQIAVESPFNRG